MAGEFLFEVEDLFEVPGRGVVLVPGVPPESSARVGDEVELRRPDGSVTRGRITGMQYSGRDPTTPMPIMVAELSRADVPTATEVWKPPR